MSSAYKLTLLAIAPVATGLVWSVPQQSQKPCDAVTPAETRITAATRTFVSTAGVFTWCIAGYHDEQRLHDGNGASRDYGPIAHVFAVPDLATMRDHSRFDDGYVNVAVIDLDELEQPMPSPYTALRLNTLHSCLYLMHNHGSGPQGDFFSAIMEPGTDAGCPLSPFPNANNSLGVRIERFSDDANDYPPVARFIEGAGGRTFIGVRCANRWCVVGAEPMGAIPNSAHQNDPRVPNNRMTRVKGWFDDQVVGVKATGTKHGIRREIRASLIPDPSLAHFGIADYQAGFKPVATAYFPTAPTDAKYSGKFGFVQGPNTIELKADADSTQPGGLKWIARINGSTKEYKVVRMDHSKFLTSVPATARFHWSDADEDVWVACAVGCCLIDGLIW